MHASSVYVSPKLVLLGISVARKVERPGLPALSLSAYGAAAQETQAAQNEELAKLLPTDFTEGIAIMSNDGWDWKLKYM